MVIKQKFTEYFRRGEENRALLEQGGSVILPVKFPKFFSGFGHNDDKVLVLAATNTPYALDQVKDVLFDPICKTQDAMFFIKTSDGTWMPCSPKQPGVVQITMQELAAQGLAVKVLARQRLSANPILKFKRDSQKSSVRKVDCVYVVFDRVRTTNIFMPDRLHDKCHFLPFFVGN